MKAVMLLITSAAMCLAQQAVDLGGPPKFVPYSAFQSPEVIELRALRLQLQQQADWAAIYQLYPNNPAFYRWLENNPHRIPYYLGR